MNFLRKWKGLAWVGVLIGLSACAILGNPTPLPVVQTLPPPGAQPPVPTASPTSQMQIGLPPLPDTPTSPPEIVIPPTDTPVPTEPVWPYQVQIGMPRRVPNLFHANGTCEWMGIGGQVLDVNGAPATDFIAVEVTGRIAGLTVNQFTSIGMAPAYGPAGFEITLANQPLGSTGSLQIRLYDANLQPLSAPVTFDTAPSCQENLVLINFTANPASFPSPTPSPVPTATPAAEIYLPVIIH
ncbi:MAG: hypothetical protein Fur0018_20760 [Anaerolineales bacterium]